MLYLPFSSSDNEVSSFIRHLDARYFQKTSRNQYQMTLQKEKANDFLSLLIDERLMKYPVDTLTLSIKKDKLRIKEEEVNVTFINGDSVKIKSLYHDFNKPIEFSFHPGDFEKIAFPVEKN